MKSYLTVMTDQKKLLGRWYLIFFIILFLILLGFLNPLRGQDWSQYTIEDNSQECAWVRMVDMDGDEDMDVVAIAHGDLMEIVWYEAPSWNKHLIDGDADGPWVLEVADMDGDGDLDVVSSQRDAGTIVWYEAPSWEKYIITSDLEGAVGLQVEDMDGDDTLDVVACGIFSNTVVWYEAPLWEEYLIAENFNGATWAHVVDIDGDDTLDVLATAIGENAVKWFKGPDWLPNTVDDDLPGAGFFDVADLNLDGIPDVVCTGMVENNYGHLVWYEGPNWLKKVIDNRLRWPYGLKIADINGDPYPDIICSAELSNDLNWYAGPAMTKHVIDSYLFRALSVDAGDMDGDKDLDIVATTFEPGEIFWYENTLPTLLNVPADFTTIQAAIDAAVDGDVVLVEDDTYYENINFKGKAITVTSRFYVDGDTSHISNTIINGSQHTNPDSGSVVYFTSGEDTNSVLCGFTITGGSGTKIISNNLTLKGGAGIRMLLSGGIVENNIITENTLQGAADIHFGAGMSAICNSGNYILVRENTFKNNSIIAEQGASWGAGIGITTEGTMIFERNTVSYNEIDASDIGIGGGIMVDGNWDRDGQNILNRNIISYNEVHCVNNLNTRGAGIAVNYAHATITNNIIHNNTCEGYGGGLHLNHPDDIGRLSQMTLINNTVVQNESPHGGGIFVRGNYFNPVVINSILWNNIGGDQISSIAENLVVVYSDIQGGWTGDGNIDLDPLFADTIGYQLSDNSPCISAATDSIKIDEIWYYCPDHCIGDNPRPMPEGTIPDIGACENPNGVTHILYNEFHIPQTFKLSQNYPNPFNPTTAIGYQLSAVSDVELSVYNLLGQKVVTLVSERQAAGYYKVEWDASGFASGVYYYRIEAGEFVDVKKMILLR